MPGLGWRITLGRVLGIVLLVMGVEQLALAESLAPISRSVAVPAGAPEVKGFDTKIALMTAIALKQVPLITVPKEAPEGVIEEKNLEYRKVGERSLQLDLYRSKTQKEGAPILVFVHGGAWKGGKRSDYKHYAMAYAQKGYLTATVSYRLTQEAAFPACLEDVRGAIRWMRLNAGKYGADPKQLGVVGASAGGHLALMAGFTSGVAGQDEPVQVVVNFYGPTDLTTETARTNVVVVSLMGGKSYLEAPELYRAASPLFQVHQGVPPTLTFHGTLDDVVPVDQGDRLVAQLASVNAVQIYDRFEGWPHAMDVALKVNERCQFVMDAFLKKHLKPSR